MISAIGVQRFMILVFNFIFDISLLYIYQNFFFIEKIMEDKDHALIIAEIAKNEDVYPFT